MRQILSVLLENESAALSRVVSLFAQRGYSIERLTFTQTTNDPTVSCMTIHTMGNKHRLEQIKKNLYKLVDVIRVHESRRNIGRDLEREVMLVKTKVRGLDRIAAVKQCISLFQGQILDVTTTIYTAQLVGTSRKIDEFLATICKLSHIIEVARSGIIVLTGISKRKDR